jgi:hypothetical protein
MRWYVVANKKGRRCIVPGDDLREHTTDDVCWCKPREDDGVIIHNSMDQREIYEREGLQ